MLRPSFKTLVSAGLLALAASHSSEAADPVYVTPPAAANKDNPGATGPEIGPLLPERVGHAVCYSGTFTGTAVDLEDWSHTTREIVPGVLQFGEPVWRPKPLDMPRQGVREITLSLTYDDRKADYDWIYNFLIKTRMEDGKALFAAGECPWYDGRHLNDEHELVAGPTKRLGCGIDCDGGGMGVTRVAGTPDLDFRFWGDGFGLRMSAGCSGGSYRAGTGEQDDEISFILKPAPAAQCAPLDAWAREE